MTGHKLSDEELREALIERGHEKAAAALEESVRQRTRSRERGEGTNSAREEADMNALIRAAAGRA